MASRVELVFEKVATLPQAKTTPQINPVPPKSNPGHGGRLRFLVLISCRPKRELSFIASVHRLVSCCLYW